jgi:hypothetical protein
MSGLQDIINNSDSIIINRRRVIGLQFTRNEIIRTAETPTRNTWKFTVNQNNGLSYYNNRDLLEQLDLLDRMNPQDITFGDNPKMNWMFAYRGQLSTANLATVTVNSFVGNKLILNMPGAYAAGTVIFEQNDPIQIGGFPFPFTSTQRYTGANIASNRLTVTTHRPNFISNSVVNQPIVVGADVKFRVICVNMPAYRLVPGAFAKSSTGQVINNARIVFEEPFEFVEYTG